MSPFLDFATNASMGPMSPIVPDSSKVVFLTPYERKGVVFMAVAGVTSCTFVSTLLFCIIFSALSPWPKPRPGAPPPFTSKQVAVFVICLLTSDLIQSLSGIVQVHWARQNRIYEGSACSFQAATLVMGDLGSTVWSCVIAGHTFSALALGKQWSRWVVVTIVVVGWSFAITLTLIGPTMLTTEDHGAFFSIAGTWCFISSEYAIPRLVIHYIPLFLASAIILVSYLLVFLVLRRSIHVVRRHLQGDTVLDNTHVFCRKRVAVSKRMLWYPAAYLTCIMPIGIIRVVGLVENNVPGPVWIFGMVLLFFLGAVDSVIYATTRKMLKLTSFSMSMNTLRENSSTSIASNALQKSTSSKQSAYFNRDTDKAVFDFSSPAEEDPEDGVQAKRDGAYPGPQTDGIHGPL